MKKTMIFIGVVLLGFTACKSTKDTVQAEDQVENRSNKERKRGGQGRLSPEQMFAEMDANKDSKLDKTEVKGPMAENFSTVDSNSDGFITLEELKNAPKPQRGGRGGRG